MSDYKNHHSASEKKRESESCEGVCPYYLRDRGNGVIYCECAKFRFPDKLARREVVYRYCAHPEHYKKCMLKQAMDHYYERKYSMIDADEKGGMSLEASKG